MLKSLPVRTANPEGSRDGFGGDGSGAGNPTVMRDQEWAGCSGWDKRSPSEPPAGSPTRDWGRKVTRIPELATTKERGLRQGSCPRLTPRRRGVAWPGGEGSPRSRGAPPAPATDRRLGRAGTPQPRVRASGAARSLSSPAAAWGRGKCAKLLFVISFSTVRSTYR